MPLMLSERIATIVAEFSPRINEKNCKMCNVIKQISFKVCLPYNVVHVAGPRVHSAIFSQT